jgi:hypothetical protein
MAVADEACACYVSSVATILSAPALARTGAAPQSEERPLENGDQLTAAEFMRRYAAIDLRDKLRA